MNARALLVLVCGFGPLAPILRAHPVAQGALWIDLQPGAIEVRAGLSNEEAFVESSFGADGAAPTLAALYARHGAYWLRHFTVLADDRALAGEVVAVTPPRDSAPGTLIGYTLRFPTGAAPVRRLALRQDVLNEFIFAPGNPWEASYVVRVAQSGRLVREGALLARREPLALAVEVEAAGSSRGAMARAFVWHGIMHILGGYDHLLFIASLVLAAVSLGDLVKVVTAFTVAHTLTLTAAVLDWFRLPSAIVEPMIAASIVFVALENIFAPQRSRGWVRLAVAFGFGLFHGLGFAGGLLTVMEGMSRASVLLAIAMFSLGVELGHQAISLPLFFGLRGVRRAAARHPDPEYIPRRAVLVASAAISLAGLVYFGAALQAALASMAA